MLKLILPLIILSLFLSVSLSGQSQDTLKSKKTKREMTKFNTVEERTGIKFRIVPGPSYDPSTKFGFFLLPMVTFYPSKNDTISPASIANVFGMYTTNKSYMYGGAAMLNFNEDKWRTRLVGARGKFNKQIRLYNVIEGTQQIDTSRSTQADAGQNLTYISASGMRRVFKGLFLGLAYNYKKVFFTGNDSFSDTLLVANGLNTKNGNHGLGVKADYDTRDNIQYPYYGYYISYTGYNYFPTKNLNNDYFSNSIEILGFWSLSKNHRHILGVKLFGSFLSGNPDPANFAYYGRVGGDVQRGYESGRRVDKNATNIEIEYRITTPWFNNRIRFMALFGGGKVFGEYSTFTNAEWLPVGGVGVRYALLPYARINIRLDLTYSKDGFIWYFGVREAF